MSLDQARTGLLDVVEQLRIAKARLEKVADTVQEFQDTEVTGGGHVGSLSAERLIQGTADNLTEDLEETIEELERVLFSDTFAMKKSYCDRP